MNTQPIEKRRESDAGTSLDVHSVFLTIQGEGPFTGHAAVFVRLAGCNLQCPLCDTDYTSTRTATDIHDLAALVHQTRHESATNLVVITGGEPLRQNIFPFVTLLLSRGYRVQIETNGTLPLPDGMGEVCSTDTRRANACFIVVSPKTGKVHPTVELHACAFKYVMSYDSEDHDGLPINALDHSATPRVARPTPMWRGPIYLQPVDVDDIDVNDAHLSACVQSCKRNGYILQLQIHKLIGVE